MLCFKALSKKNGLALCISVNSRSAGEIIRKCTQFAQAIKALTNGKIDYTTSFDCIKFSNGCRVMSLPSTSASLRGFTSTCVCIDEAAYVWHLDEILQAIGPTLTRDPDAELVFASTPAGKNGPFYELYQKALYDEEFYVQQTTIYDAIEQGLTIDVNSLKTLCPDPDVFKQEYLCEFMSEYGSMIDTQLLDWYEEAPKEAKTNYLGMDIGRTHDRSAIVIAKTYKDMTYVDNIVMLNKTPYQEQMDIVKNLHAKHAFLAGYIDQTGIGSAFAEFVTNKVSTKIKGLQFTGSNKPVMYEDLRSKIFNHKVAFNKAIKPIIEPDLKNVQRIVTESGTVKYQAGRDENGHSDSVSALVLAIKAIHDNPLNASLPTTASFSSRLGCNISRL